jgi:hypothetical protein
MAVRRTIVIVDAIRFDEKSVPDQQVDPPDADDSALGLHRRSRRRRRQRSSDSSPLSASSRARASFAPRGIDLLVQPPPTIVIDETESQRRFEHDEELFDAVAPPDLQQDARHGRARPGAPEGPSSQCSTQPHPQGW